MVNREVGKGGSVAGSMIITRPLSCKSDWMHRAPGGAWTAAFPFHRPSPARSRWCMLDMHMHPLNESHIPAPAIYTCNTPALLLSFLTSSLEIFFNDRHSFPVAVSSLSFRFSLHALLNFKDAPQSFWSTSNNFTSNSFRSTITDPDTSSCRSRVIYTT